jgi:hypothetical protein
MADIFLVVIIVSAIVGIKTPILGSIAGAVTAGVMYYFLNNQFEIMNFALHIVVGVLFGYLSPVTFRWIFSGFRGGRGKTEPGVTWIGGFGGTGRQYSGGIIPTENELLENKKPEKQFEVFIIKLIRILIFPLTCLAVLLYCLFFL